MEQPPTTETSATSTSPATTTPPNQTPPEAKASDSTTEPKTAEAPSEPITLESLQVPEGFDRTDPYAKEFVDILNAKDKNTSQKLVDLYVKVHERNMQEWLDKNAEWQEELRADQQYGGAKLDPGLANVSKLIKEFSASHGGEKVEHTLRSAFDQTGAGNHPAIVKFLIWTANQLSEGAPLSGQPAGGTEVSRAQKLFGT